MTNEMFLILICLLLIVFFERLLKQNKTNSEIDINQTNINTRKKFLMIHLKNVIKLCKIAIIVIAIKIIFKSFDNFINTF